MGEDIELKKRKIKEEIDALRYEFKVELPKKIAQARSYGDLSENAEYHAARERQAFVKARITQLSLELSRLSDMKVGDIPEDASGYCSVLTVVDLDTEEREELTLVNSNEASPREGKISLMSPIGSALNNKTAGDTVEAVVPVGKRRLYIEKIVTIHGAVIEKPYKEG